MIFDTFSFRDEFDMLELRLTELQNVPDLKHILVEADVTHGGNKPKPYYFRENRHLFSKWADRLIDIQAYDLPDDVDAWSRELAQREWCWKGLHGLNAQPDDIVLHGDLDEIPTALATQFVRPRGFVRFRQTLYCFAVDWQHPEPWWGTVAARVRDVGKFADMRTARCWMLPEIPDAGWHLSWMGTHADNLNKIDSFCHPEIVGMGWRDRLEECYQTGLHVDGTKLIPVDVDESWPKWIREGHAPESWYRPR